MTRTTLVCASGMSDHTPMYAEVDLHHVIPMYMTSLLGLPMRVNTAPLCSGCHDLAHHVLHHLVNEGTPGGHRLAPGLRRLVDVAWVWWREALGGT